MQRTAGLLALLAVLMSVAISSFAARQITHPIQVLTATSRAIARGDFSQRINLKSRTEIGELAATFNTMSEELEQFVDLRRVSFPAQPEQNAHRHAMGCQEAEHADQMDEHPPSVHGKRFPSLEFGRAVAVIGAALPEEGPTMLSNGRATGPAGTVPAGARGQAPTERHRGHELEAGHGQRDQQVPREATRLIHQGQPEE